MADWSKIFEQRLQTVLSESKNKEKKERQLHAGAGGSASVDFDLTPPPTTSRKRGASLTTLPPRPLDPTAAFFDSIRRQRYPDGDDVGGSGHGETALWHRERATAIMMTPAAQTVDTPASFSTGQADMKELQGSYSKRAKDLHSEATQRMAAVQETFGNRLARMADQEEAFLHLFADKQAQFNKPATAWTVKIQTREKGSNSTNSSSCRKNGQLANQKPVEKEERIVDRIATMRASAAALEADLAKLWQTWEQAQGDAATALRTVLGDGEEGHEAQHLDRILAEADKELEAAAAEALKEMRHNEKTFRKLILAEECKLAQTMLARQSKYD
ncbi:hypothetical protein SPI_01205 [Niveomyces insectorum RCEF 264]|uniref:Uncharacterized protein n=1 Tax=Niveomyces insectorum RCEF 264 TaxID=1081102 RepID=A0A167YSB8_9HYPO|nr:hypothetical protein SPI_01205 [Niveomyces insectorum RCEF 264]